jgi:hypothetical protein
VLSEKKILNETKNHMNILAIFFKDKEKTTGLLQVTDKLYHIMLKNIETYEINCVHTFHYQYVRVFFVITNAVDVNISSIT